MNTKPWLILIMLAESVTMLISGCGAPPPRPTNTVAAPPASPAPAALAAPTKPEDVRTVTFNIKGMTWPVNCPLAVVTAYKSTKGVIEAVANFSEKTVAVTYDSAKTKPESLLTVLAGTPYSASMPESASAKQ